MGEVDSRWTTLPPEQTPSNSFKSGSGDISASEISIRPSPLGSASAKPCWLTVTSSHRHIRLPINGELVLGRFDPTLGIPPDIDLAHEDGGVYSISRRHAKIVGANGRHTIEDLGSLHGVFVNSEQIKFGPSRQLKPGDQIALGDLRLYYDFIPFDFADAGSIPNGRHTLLITATGQKLTIVPPDEITIGRSDRYVNFVPEIDLSPVGEVAARVSRRHSIITWRNHVPYLEDLGSGFGTRLNGEMLLIGQAIPLKPGDHIWLGGCVLAYDIEI
jgi:pSer/pThr/pTyr-binding forkhead associated (FHA) protein